MGARLTKFQPILPVTIRAGEVEVIDLLGASHNLNLPIDLTVEKDKMDFDEDVFINVIKGSMQLVVRRDMTWSVLHSKTRLLLDIGSFEFKEKHLFFTEYMPVGYMSANNKVSSVMLDLSNRRLLHGMRGPTMSNGFDFILKEPLLDIADISPEVSLSLAHTCKDPRPRLHIWTTGLRELEVKYDVLARDFQI